METIILIASFLGSWLLVAGSIYQAVLELRDEDIEVDRVRRLSANVVHIKKVSSWWWFVPPVKIILERKRNEKFRKAYFDALTTDDSAAMLSFMNKATAWLYVGLGGFLLAVKETYELDEYLHVGLIVFFIAIVVLLVVAFLNTITRVRRSEQILKTKK
jgi:hypothetical protein